MQCRICDGAGCDACERRLQSALIHREWVALALLIAIAAAAFVVTRSAAEANHRRRLRDAAVWYERGTADLAGGRLPRAVDALRAAAALDTRNTPYRLVLARALTASHDDAQARQLLSALRSRNPESAPINLQLARLEARAGEAETAIAYYQNALYGQWDRDQAEALRLVRLELIDYLLQLGQPSRALSELLVLSGNVRDTVDDHRAIGERFLRAAEPKRALDHFVRALTIEPANGAVLALSGQAAFDLGDYPAAQNYFRAAPRTAATDAARDLTAAVLSSDPLAPRLPQTERRTRTQQLVNAATARLDRCSVPESAALRSAVDAVAAGIERRRANVIDLVEDAVRAASQIEAAAARSCGEGGAADRAVILIARRHHLDQP